MSNTGGAGSSSTSTVDQADVQAFARNMADSAEPVTRSAQDQFERLHLDDGRVRITLGGAIVMTLLGSMATALYIRRQQRARARQIILANMISNASSFRPNARQIAPLGGGLGSLILASLIAARIRSARAQEPPHGLQQRLQAIESQLQSHGSFSQPRARDMMIGMGIGIGLSRIIGGRSHG
jgi:hypothetical protein